MFPAEIDFRRDSRPTPTERRVYDYLLTTLDFRQERQVRGLMDAQRAGVSRNSFGAALDALVAHGYLVEYPRLERNVRRFTLAWSVQMSA